jgi:hypothetical protein
VSGEATTSKQVSNPAPYPRRKHGAGESHLLRHHQRAVGTEEAREAVTPSVQALPALVTVRQAHGVLVEQMRAAVRRGLAQRAVGAAHVQRAVAALVSLVARAVLLAASLAARGSRVTRAPARVAHVGHLLERERANQETASGPNREPRRSNVELIGCQSVRQVVELPFAADCCSCVEKLRTVLSFTVGIKERGGGVRESDESDAVGFPSPNHEIHPRLHVYKPIAELIDPRSLNA